MKQNVHRKPAQGQRLIPAPDGGFGEVDNEVDLIYTYILSIIVAIAPRKPKKCSQK